MKKSNKHPKSKRRKAMKKLVRRKTILNKRKMNKHQAKERELSSFKPEDQKDILAIQAVLAGNKEAYAQIENRYRPFFLQKITLMVKRRDIAEDCVREILNKAYEKLSQYRSTHTFNAWINFLAKNLMVDFSRKSQWKSQLNDVSIDNVHTTSEDNEISFSDTLVDSGRSTDAKCLDDERRKAIREGLTTLDEVERKLIGMFYGREMRYEQMAKCMSMNVNTMKVRLMRAKHRLAEYIARAYPEFEMQSEDAREFQSVSSEEHVVDGEKVMMYFSA